MIEQYVDPYDSKDKFTFVAYNASFDYGFVRQWFVDHNDKYFGSFFHKYPIDVPTFVMEHLTRTGEIYKISNLKLETVAEFYGCTPEGKLHDARTDIILARDVYYEALSALERLTNQGELF